MAEDKEGNEQMHGEGPSTKATKENEQMHEESSSAETMKEDEQMHEESSWNQETYVESWISAKGRVNASGTDPVHQVCRQIQERFGKYCYSPWVSEGPILVNTVSSADLKPILVNIGPNHQDTIKPTVMEVHKLKYTRDLLIRTNDTVEELLRVNYRSLIHECYNYNKSHSWSDPHDVLMPMWIIDGCFIIELFLKNDEREDGLLFESERVLYALNRDLILPDNQMPQWFFTSLICRCCRPGKSYQGNDENFERFYRLAQKFLERIVPNQKLYQPSADIDRHFVDLRSIVYDGLNWPLPSPTINKIEVGYYKWNMVKSATELEEFGVKFKMIEIANFVDIKFTTKGVLEIPLICIQHGTPDCIKVLLQYEQNHRQSRYLSNYLWFMNSLVKSPTDVQLLRQKGIIDNLSELSDDAAIHKFLKDLNESLTISRNNFNYIQLCMDLNSHCSNQRNAWMPKLKRDYFNSPWAIISVFAASLLLILTVAQTVYSAASYYKQG